MSIHNFEVAQGWSTDISRTIEACPKGDITLRGGNYSPKLSINGKLSLSICQTEPEVELISI
ncbi:uncharacterized protein PHALS_05274 [Plasmopara halstedii]|uniref:Uncharacterized protein n=1 Tax=Plasmopara halstedii TaxID=4781 RepID=A0A0P1B3K7_PLAHL|nr:uncharacterized protein PHALS_05274 [Plasmopara halstedii]CEG47951.1 hypothetical protein PHALS_05274 [Plasmopara halstedii]|eukprot:XP_024584320.1 hypothetical protein PHALS_05274 [Plasmopara halstedii]